jgi:hypothetical protein
MQNETEALRENYIARLTELYTDISTEKLELIVRLANIFAGK